MLDYKNQEHFLKPIIEAINKGQLILFVGSGVSKLCGLPLWKELAKSLLMHCAEDPKCSTFSYRDFDEILNYIDDERELISIAKNILNKAYKDDETFYNLLCKQLTPKDENHKDNLKMQSLLFSFADTIITTNADQILDNQLNSENVIYNVADFEKYKIEGVHKVIHIHGSINDCNSLVFTTAEYLLRYADNKFRKSITNIFSSTSPYVVLFVGYGFREMQLLDFLVNVESKEIREKKTFYLNGYFSNQENIFDVESEYYKTYGVTLVSYYRDAKNYHGLFDALEYIRDEAAKKSLKNFRKINKLVDIINQEPNENSVQTLENEYIFQSETFKTHILESVSKSSFAKQWTESIVSSSKLSKEIFNVDNLVEGEPFINSFSGVPFPGLALLANIDVFSNDTKSFYYSFIKDVVKKYATDNKLFSNSIAYKSFLKLIFSREEFLIDKEISNDIYTFLNSFVKNAPEPDIWMLFASYKDDILKIHSQTPIKCLVGLMLKTLSKMNNVVSYEFSQFFNAYSDSFCSNFPKSGIKRLISKLEEISSSFYSRDVISVEIDKKEGSVDAYSYLNKWLSKVIKNLKNDDANKLFDYLIASCDDLKCIIAIYVANIHFSSLKNKFFENLNRFNKRIYFSEIYSLFKENVFLLTDKEVNAAVSFAESIQYDSEFSSLLSKFYLVKLFACKFPKNESLSINLNRLNSKITSSNGNSWQYQINPLNISKDFFISAVWETEETDELENKILAMDLDTFIRYVKTFDSCKNSMEVYTISNIFDQIQQKFDLYNIDKLALFENVPDYFADILENHIHSSKLDLHVKFEYLVNIEERRNSRKTATSFLQSLCFEIANSEKIDTDLRRNIFKYVKDINLDQMSDEVQIPQQLNDLFSNAYFLKFSILVMICNNDDFPELISLIENELRGNNNFVKAAISSKIEYLWEINSSWVIENLKTIFDNNLDKENLSFSAFACSQFSDPVFVYYLNSKNILEPLLLSNEFNSVAHWYAYIVLRNYLYYGENKDACKAIFKTNYYHYSLNLLLDYIQKNKKSNFDGDKFDDILSALMIDKKMNDGLYTAGIKMLECFDKEEISPTKLEFIKFAFSLQNSTSDCARLVDILNKKNFGEDINSQVAKAYLMKLKNPFYHVEEACELFRFVKKDDKNEVMNSLGDANPVFLTKLRPE